MRPLLPWCFFLLGVAAAGWLAGFAYRNREYYALPAVERSFHPAHADLRPSGRSGLILGIAGTVLIATNLTYLVRKSLLPRSRLGSLRSWMAFHVMTGLLGAACILLHAAILPRSSLGILAFAGLATTIITGIIGRYVYARVPRAVEGRELEANEIRQRLDGVRGELERLGFDLGWLDSRMPAFEPARSALGRLRSVILGDAAVRRFYSALRAGARSSERARLGARPVLPLIRRLLRERSWLLRYHELRVFMSGWRFLHRWLALLMLLLAAYHIGIAVRYGDLWLLER